MVRENLREVEERIRAACERSDRDPADVTLVAVSKTKPVEMIREAYEAGVRDFGENKVQEMMDKYEQLPGDIRWHMIGHLQRNKVKYLIGKVHLIHSVDSLRLAEEISAQSAKRDVDTNILIEVNIAGEESKFGIAREETLTLAEEIAQLPRVHIQGLMVVAPYVTDPEENRSYFREIRELSVDIAQKNIDNICVRILSMGMTGDYTVAIEEGATIVRVGTGIFGKRNYQNQKMGE